LSEEAEVQALEKISRAESKAADEGVGPSTGKSQGQWERATSTRAKVTGGGGYFRLETAAEGGKRSYAC